MSGLRPDCHARSWIPLSQGLFAGAERRLDRWPDVAAASHQQLGVRLVRLVLVQLRKEVVTVKV